jgi:4-hydroxy-tetrahydrodipicolinate synthase
LERQAGSRVAQRLAHGLIPAVPTPHRADGRLDPEALEAYAAWMARQDIAGVAVWAHTGRGLHLEQEVAAQVFQIWQQALGKDRLIVAGAGARPRRRKDKPSVRLTPPADPMGLTRFVIDGTIEMAQQAKELGADALLVFPPVLLKDLEDSERRIVDVHAALADVGLPVIAFYLYEAAGGIDYTPRTVDRVLALEHVIGIKVATLDSVVTFQDVALRMPPQKLLVSGEDRFLGYSLMMGARAALIGLAAARTSLSAALLRAYAAEDWPRFHELAALCDRFAQVAFTEPMEGYIRRMLWVLASDGVIPWEGAHDPWGPEVPAWQLEALGAALPSFVAA